MLAVRVEGVESRPGMYYSVMEEFPRCDCEEIGCTCESDWDTVDRPPHTVEAMCVPCASKGVEGHSVEAWEHLTPEAGLCCEQCGCRIHSLVASREVSG